jgi:hypothetical protein
MPMKMQVVTWERHTHVVGLKGFMGSNSPLLIIGFLMTIWIIKYNTKPKQIFFHRKKNTIKKRMTTYTWTVR